MGKEIIYQMLPRLWGEGRFSSIDKASLDYIKSLSVSCVWYTGIIRHSAGKAFVKGSWGSPYAISDYYDVNPYLADNESERMDEFKSLIKRTHEAGLKVIIDFVPNHVGRDYGESRCRTDVAYLGDGDDKDTHWKEENDFFYYPGKQLILPFESDYVEMPARATGNSYTHTPDINDWYDTIKINYCTTHTATWDKMLDILLFWADLGVDGFRCDMVELVPEEFFRWAIAKVKALHPAVIFIAEVYQKDSYRKYIRQTGFDLLYDKSGLYDALRDIVMKNVIGSATPYGLWQSARNITGNWQMLADLQPHMLNFLENHDEQRFASPFFGEDASNTFAPLAVSALFNTASFMLYSGEEIGASAPESEDGRTSIFNVGKPEELQRLATYARTGAGLDGKQAGILGRFREMMALASSPAFASGMVYDLCWCNNGVEGFDPVKHFAFIRKKDSEAYLIFCNFSRRTASTHINIPEHAAEMLDIHQGMVEVEAQACDISITKIN